MEKEILTFDILSNQRNYSIASTAGDEEKIHANHKLFADMAECIENGQKKRYLYSYPKGTITPTAILLTGTDRVNISISLHDDKWILVKSCDRDSEFCQILNEDNKEAIRFILYEKDEEIKKHSYLRLLAYILDMSKKPIEDHVARTKIEIARTRAELHDLLCQP